MQFKDLAEVLINDNITAYEVDDFKYEFVHEKYSQLFGFWCFKGRIVAPYVKNVCLDTGIIQFDPHNWIDELMQ
jgi:hypothetical protein